MTVSEEKKRKIYLSVRSFFEKAENGRENNRETAQFCNPLNKFYRLSVGQNRGKYRRQKYDADDTQQIRAQNITSDEQMTSTIPIKYKNATNSSPAVQ